MIRRLSPRLALAVALGLSIAPTAHAADPNESRLATKAQACIESNAALIERADPNLEDAAQFLLGYVCASEVAARERYAQNSNLLTMYRAMNQNLDGDDDHTPNLSPAFRRNLAAQAAKMKAAYEAARVDPDTGDIIWPAGTPPTLFAIGLTVGTSQDAPTDLRALAGKALLEAREARLKTQGPR
jgi:hypothetical protein